MDPVNDEEPKICTVFSSNSGTANSVFDTIAFSSIQRRDEISFPSFPVAAPTATEPELPSQYGSVYSIPSVQEQSQFSMEGRMTITEPEGLTPYLPSFSVPSGQQEQQFSVDTPINLSEPQVSTSYSSNYSMPLQEIQQFPVGAPINSYVESETPNYYYTPTSAFSMPNTGQFIPQSSFPPMAAASEPPIPIASYNPGEAELSMTSIPMSMMTPIPIQVPGPPVYGAFNPMAMSMLADDLQSGDHLHGNIQPHNQMQQPLPQMSMIENVNTIPCDVSSEKIPISGAVAVELLENTVDCLSAPLENLDLGVEVTEQPIYYSEIISEKVENISSGNVRNFTAGSDQPTAITIFDDSPEAPYPVGSYEDQGFSSTMNQFFQPQPVQMSQPYPVQSVDIFSPLVYSPDDVIYDAWIPPDETKNILESIAAAVHSGTYFADKSHMTAPGILYEDDLIDKVGVNMARIFGEAEASKRKILTADSVTQDDNGLRELIKLGCYRSAINLTKRLLTLYGQGSGKVGHYSKHTPHSLQLWFTRISLLMRIREFAIAESEIDAFKYFDNPDLYYEYYPDSYGGGRKGSMVPFYFRLLAAEIPQYVRKINETADRLHKILCIIQKILKNVEAGLCEAGNDDAIVETDRKEKSLAVWKKREIRVLYSGANASLFAKDYYNAYTILSKLCDKDKEHQPQLKSAIGRLFLQHGDLTSAQKYFQQSSELRSSESEVDQVETLIDSALVSIAQNSYPEAFALLQQALQIQPENFTVTNNMAVCLLYMGKVKDSLTLMESTVKQNTPQLLQENVILNLSTIYELENSDGYKKNALLKLISEYKGDGINLASLKMPNLI